MSIVRQADAIISKLQTTGNPERVDEPTLLIAADTVCRRVSFSWHLCPIVKCCWSLAWLSQGPFTNWGYTCLQILFRGCSVVVYSSLNIIDLASSAIFKKEQRGVILCKYRPLIKCCLVNLAINTSCLFGSALHSFKREFMYLEAGLMIKTSVWHFNF